MFKEKINEIRAKLRQDNAAKEATSTSGKIPKQYPNMKPKESPKESLIHMVSSLVSMDLNDSDNDTDDEAMQYTSSFMVRSFTSVNSTSIDPPEIRDHIMASNIPSGESMLLQDSTSSGEDNDDTIEVKAHFEYSIFSLYQDKTYAISDGGLILAS